MTESADTEMSIDDEVYDLLLDMINLLCNAQDGEVEIKPWKGNRMVTYIVHVTNPRYPGMIIGHQGQTIAAIRRFLLAVGGAHKRTYAFDIAETPRPGESHA